MAANAALLDELMGRNRNLAPEEMKAAEVHFDHVTVCKYYLCGFCPHELFRNTRVDIGPCDKLHEDDLVNEYKTSKKCSRMGYEDDFNRFVQSLITDIDKRIRSRGEQRLNVGGGGGSAREERLQWLSQRLNELHRDAEQAGCDGRVDESQRMMRQADQLNDERQQLERQAVSGPVGGGSKEMEVCPICGSFQVKNEAPAKVEEHIKGRQHIGYATLRGYLKGLEEDRKNKAEAERLEAEERRKKREEDDKKRGEEREERKEKSQSRSDTTRASSSRRRSRSPRERRRSRSRDNARRSRSRDRRRSRSRERRRSRDRSDRKRSRSRERRDDRRDDRRDSGRDSGRDRRRSRSKDRRRSRRSRSKDRRRSRSRDRSRRDRSKSRDRSKRSSKSKERSSRDSKDTKELKQEKKEQSPQKEKTEADAGGDAKEQNGAETSPAPAPKVVWHDSSKSEVTAEPEKTEPPADVVQAEMEVNGGDN